MSQCFDDTFFQISLNFCYLSQAVSVNPKPGTGGGAEQICESNLILHILTKFHDDDFIYTKIMAILSTNTSGISNVFYRNL